MMNYLLFTVGTDGDLNPYLALGLELQNRGHRATLLTNPSHKQVVRSAGLGFLPIGDGQQLDDYINHPDYFEPSKSWQLALDACFLGPMRKTYQIIARCHAREPTTVISAAWGFGARIANEKLGVPLVTVHLEPHNIRSMHQTGVMPPPMIVNDWVPKTAKRLQFWMADRWFVDPRICPELNSFRRELGLPAVNRVVKDWWNSPQRIIGMYPEWLVPPQPDWPSQLRLVGFPLWDRSEASAAATEAVEFAKQCRPIVFTAGSNQRHARDFFAAAIHCCDTLGRCGILVGKQAVTIPARLADRVRHFEYVGFSKLLPLASAIVHHGGVGTTAHALAAGIPQVVVPTVHGTPDIARRLQRIGVAEVIKPAAFTATHVADLLRKVFGSEQTRSRCRRCQSKMQSEDAITRTCQLLDEFETSLSRRKRKHAA